MGVDTLTLIPEIQHDIRRVNILKVLIRKCRIEPPRHEDLEYSIWRISNGYHYCRAESSPDPFGMGYGVLPIDL